MLKTVLAACAVLCALCSSAVACVETGTVMRPVCMNNNFLAGVRSINVTMKRDRRSREAVPARRAVKAARRPVSSPARPRPRWATASPGRRATSQGGWSVPSTSTPRLPSAGYVARTLRLPNPFCIGAGPPRLCLVRSRYRIAGAAGMSRSSRKSGATVRSSSRNPSPRGRGWQEAVYRHRAIGFRVPG